MTTDDKATAILACSEISEMIGSVIILLGFMILLGWIFWLAR